MSFALQSGPGERFSRTPAADCRRMPPSPNTPTRHDGPMFHHTLVLEPALRVYKIYNRSLVLRPLDGGGIGYRRRMVMRYPVRIRPTWRTRMRRRAP